VLKAARTLLQPHIDVNWLRELSRL
jgi:hypothetical protein